MSFIGTTINPSPTITGVAAAEIKAGAGKAVKFDANGKIVLCSVAGEKILGILLMQTPDVVAAGDSVTIQIKDIGMAAVGAEVAAGAELTTDANGLLVTATSGAFILGMALKGAAASGDLIEMQITKSGYKAGGTVTPLTLNGLSDVVTTTPSAGDILIYDGTKWVNDTLGLDDLNDVAITTAADGDTLTYDGTGTTWENTAAQA